MVVCEFNQGGRCQLAAAIERNKGILALSPENQEKLAGTLAIAQSTMRKAGRSLDSTTRPTGAGSLEMPKGGNPDWYYRCSTPCDSQKS